MMDNLPTSSHFWTPPASFRVKLIWFYLYLKFEFFQIKFISNLEKKKYQVQLNRNVKNEVQIDKGYSCVRFGQKFEKIAK